MRFIVLLLVCVTLVLSAGCSKEKPVSTAPQTVLPGPDPPQNAMKRLVAAYEQENAAAYQAMFTGDFTYEFSNSTDPTLVQEYSAGWFKIDEKQSSSHLFTGYTPPGGQTLPAATSITITLAVDLPVDDNSPGVDPATHKICSTRVDGDITVPQSGSEPLTYVISNNYDVFYWVRGDVAVGLDSSQPADDKHWYVYRWVDLSEAAGPAGNGAMRATKVTTWGSVKASYR